MEWVEINDAYRRMFCLWDIAVKGKVDQAESSVNDSVIHVLDSLFDGIHMVNNVLILAGNISLADCYRIQQKKKSQDFIRIRYTSLFP